MTVKEKVYKLTLTLNRESDKISDIDRNSHVQFSEGDSYKKNKSDNERGSNSDCDEDGDIESDRDSYSNIDNDNDNGSDRIRESKLREKERK